MSNSAAGGCGRGYMFCRSGGELVEWGMSKPTLEVSIYPVAPVAFGSTDCIQLTMIIANHWLIIINAHSIVLHAIAWLIPDHAGLYRTTTRQPRDAPLGGPEGPPLPGMAAHPPPEPKARKQKTEGGRGGPAAKSGGLPCKLFVYDKHTLNIR